MATLQSAKLQSRPTPLTLVSDNSYPATTWWMHQWLATMLPFAKAQLSCWEAFGNLMQHEAEFFRTMATSSEQLARCTWDPDMLRDPTAMTSCYQAIAGDMTEATMKRMLRVTELSRDFRECLWDEL